MWSGPRNISTAMMRAFENRADCAVSDEPFYAAFLATTGLEHPMRAEVLAAQPTDWRAVAEAMAGPAPGGAAVWYQKHMCHHMLPGFGLDWTDACTNAFLIRDPAAVVASYARKHDAVSLDAIGVVRQCELFERVADRTGKAPAVLESADVLADPRAALAALCEALAIPFSESMLAWPAGRRESDGVWAPAWYDVVERSTGFDRPAPRDRAPLPAGAARVADAARPYYERMARHALAA
ncbi:sulfotransferase family protein [Novosphingobium sp. PC22D]|nr:sulfotransferase family protein [Novosphingobium sp. PC22D]